MGRGTIKLVVAENNYLSVQTVACNITIVLLLAICVVVFLEI